MVEYKLVSQEGWDKKGLEDGGLSESGVGVVDLAVATTAPNELLIGNDGEDGCNYVGNPEGSSEDDQKALIGTGQNDGILDLPDQKMFNFPEQFQMDQTPNENDYFALEDFLNPADDNYSAQDPVDGKLTYFDAPQNPPVTDESFVEVDERKPFDADQSPFEMLDEYINYFDAYDNDVMLSFNASEFGEVGVPNMVQPALIGEVHTGNEHAHLPFPEPSETNVEGASSSEQKPVIAKTAADVQFDKGWDGSIAKQVSRMLGSISAPTAFAAELPTKNAAFGQNSAARSSSSVHVTAGMIHISGMTLIDNDKIWSLGKSGNADLLLPYGMTMSNVNLLSSSFEPMGNTLSSKATAVIFRSGFYFFFLWVMLLSMSCKIGSYIYTR
ncbi:hypothetical protein IFM89_019438 [Coptis chinensis]|uniref:Uncharacterized protein n=1 Tax=Coptis chinensis TaxID=261450 RepID=A0A835HDW5_9MAGN|nr:hypothetical protein IFM89_019438 [Coptis chinensis]